MNDMTLTIKGLFGHFDYEIPLYGLGELDGLPMSDGVTILTGPNGYGKSTILRALEAVSKGDVDFFRDLKFEQFNVSRSGDTSPLYISKADDVVKIDGEKLPRKRRFPDGSMVAILQLNNDDFRLNEDSWEQTRRLCARLNAVIPSVLMISEQRLLEIQNVPSMDDGKPLEMWGEPVMTQKVSATVAGLPEKLKGHFSTARDNYAETDSKLNASFPRRVLSQSADSNLTKEKFDCLYQEMNAKLRILQENGISEFEQQDIPPFQADKAGILRIFFDDFNEKYKVYDPLIEKLTLFRKILDRRFRDFKRVEISREYGLRVRDIGEGGDGADVIPLDKLSSGEQETLVLYYQLIFETAPGTMLLIDEPEISLHIAWQMTFIDELKEIVRLNKLRAVVATHSESILDDNWDIQVDLGALYQDEREK